MQYVAGRLTAAGYNVTLDDFPFVYVPPALLQQITPIAATYETGAFTGTGFGDVTASVTPVDINLAPAAIRLPAAARPRISQGFPAGNIALIQRGTCTFADKALNAQAAGASAVIIFNQGNTPAREGLIVGTLGRSSVGIPVVGASFAGGDALLTRGNRTRQSGSASTLTQYNVIAESAGGNPNNVVMAGAHLDSVQAGPGINDNGSGSAALLEVAEQMAKVTPRNKVRFAWWGAEESGLVGSTAYVGGLSQAELDRITLYLNFDMIGSPNHVFFIYDGDDSDAAAPGPGPAGSAQIEKTFERYFTAWASPFKGTDFSGRSDYGPSSPRASLPAGSSRAPRGSRQPRKPPIWGGTAGAAVRSMLPPGV